jgi:pimeloyl-ACP methyl ester carboxylesterase
MLPYLLGMMMGCSSKYAELGPIGPDELWAPLPVRHTTVNGVDVAYVDSETVSDEPPIVLVHGLSSYLGFWEYQIPALAPTRRVIALDLPGYGSSGRPDAPYTPPWYAEQVVGLLDALGVQRADWMGHSMGGQIALTAAIEHPDRVGRLILSAPAGFESFHPGAAAFMKGYWTEERALGATEPEVRTNFVDLTFANVDDGVERLIEERVRLGQHPAFRGTSVAVSRSIAGMVDHPVYDRLGDVEAKTLVIYGTRDRMIPNPIFTGGSTRTVAERGVTRLPHAELILLDGGGHTVHHDLPTRFNAEVLRFLESAR